MTTSEERMAFLNSELKQFATRTVLLEFITRALIQRSGLTAAEVMAIMAHHMPRATPEQNAFMAEAIADFFKPLDGTQRAQ